MLDHVGFAVRDYDRSKAFYAKALAPLRMTLIMEPVGEAAGFGKEGRPSFWIEARGEPVQGGFISPWRHIAARRWTPFMRRARGRRDR